MTSDNFDPHTLLNPPAKPPYHSQQRAVNFLNGQIDFHMEDNQSSIAKRAQRRCYTCPGLPLRAECKHTGKGRQLISAREAKRVVNNIAIAFHEESSSSESFGTSLQLGAQEDSMTSELGQEILESITATPTPLNAQQLSLLLPARTRTGLNVPELETHGTLFSIGYPIDEHVENAGAQPDTQSSSATPMLTTTPSIDLPPNQLLPSATPLFHVAVDVSQEGSPITFTPRTPKKQTATQSNPIFGHVSGVKRGNSPYSIHRTKKLPSPIEESRKASQRFSRLTNKILEKCEALSQETGAWVFLGAQHTSARGGAISYASPRLCREANSTAGHLATQFNHTVAELLRARRADALTLQKKLEEAEARSEQARKECFIQQAILEKYRHKFGDITEGS